MIPENKFIVIILNLTSEEQKSMTNLSLGPTKYILILKHILTALDMVNH